MDEMTEMRMDCLLAVHSAQMNMTAGSLDLKRTLDSLTAGVTAL